MVPFLLPFGVLEMETYRLRCLKGRLFLLYTLSRVVVSLGGFVPSFLVSSLRPPRRHLDTIFWEGKSLGAGWEEPALQRHLKYSAEFVFPHPMPSPPGKLSAAMAIVPLLQRMKLLGLWPVWPFSEARVVRSGRGVWLGKHVNFNGHLRLGAPQRLNATRNKHITRQ